ncbi:hypothetical protein AC1031_010892 [Aphanomyces cochlioides]|nr:hypothetical protein AC1031_010892 [Aphanomyces cochlioides]
MKIAATIPSLATALVAFSDAQQIGTFTPEVHPVLATQKCTLAGGCVSETSKVVADANYRWAHNVGGFTSCQSNGQWDSAICPDTATCAKNCALEGYSYAFSGVITSGGKLDVQLNNRLYILEDDNLTSTTSSSTKNSPSTLMSPTFLVVLTLLSTLSPWPKTVARPATTRLEANAFANVVTPHPCVIDGVYTCSNSQQCNSCAKAGCGVNPWTVGNHTLYGPGSSFAIDTSKPFTAVTQFITDDNTANGDLVQVNRFYVQNGKIVPNPVQIMESFCSSGTNQWLQRWSQGHGPCPQDCEMSWLDAGSNGPCPASPPTVTSASYSMTNIRVGDIGSTTSVVVAPTTAPSTKAPTTAPITTNATSVPVSTKATSPPATTKSTSAPVTTKATSAPATTKATSAPTTAKPSSGAVGAYGQCGGSGHSGATTCISGYTCKAYSEWFSQCIPN